MKIYRARWVCPISAPPIENGAVAVSEDGLIRWMGASGRSPAGELEDLGNVILLPGLVNAHTHLDLTVFRGAHPGDAFFGWIRTLVDLKSRWLTEEVRRAAARVGIAEGIRAGITTFADTSDSLDSMWAMLELGVRGISYQEVFAPSAADAPMAMQGLRSRVSELRAAATPRVRGGVSPHAPYSVADELYRAVAEFALEEELSVAAHIAESPEESDYVIRGEGPFADMLRERGLDVHPRAASPLQLLRDTGVLQTRPLLIHAIQLNEGDLAAIRESGAAVVHCPVSNSRLGHGLAPLTRFLDDGIPVALGTDSMVSNDRMDLLEEARIAELLQNARWKRRGLIAPGQLLLMLTLWGARALRLDGEIGSIEPGKRADLAAFSLAGLHAAFVQRPYEALLHTTRGTDASFVLVDGRELMRDGVLAFDVAGDLALLAGVIRGMAGD